MPIQHHSHSALRIWIPIIGLFYGALAVAQTSQTDKPIGQVSQRATQRIPRQQINVAGIIGRVQSQTGAIALRASVELVSAAQSKQKPVKTVSDADGIFRVSLPPGTYLLRVEAAGFQAFEKDDISLNPGELLTVEVTLRSKVTVPGASVAAPEATDRHIASQHGEGASPEAPYRELSRRADEQLLAETIASSVVPANDQLFLARPDRWRVNMPSWDRYGRKGDYPYVMGHWWDPFNRNKFKGDYPIFGQQTFFNFTGTSTTGFDWRR